MNPRVTALKPIDAAEHHRSLLTNPTIPQEEKMREIAQIRQNTIVDIDNLVKQRKRGGGEAVPPELAANLDLLEACTSAMDNGTINVAHICSAFAKTDADLISGAKSADGGKRGRMRRDQNNEIEKEIWRKTAKEILDGRMRKPSGRELAKLVAEKLNPGTADEEINKLADSRRRWKADLL